jgi:hypothetical protein
MLTLFGDSSAPAMWLCAVCVALVPQQARLSLIALVFGVYILLVQLFAYTDTTNEASTLRRWKRKLSHYKNQAFPSVPKLRMILSPARLGYSGYVRMDGWAFLPRPVEACAVEDADSLLDCTSVSFEESLDDSLMGTTPKSFRLYFSLSRISRRPEPRKRKASITSHSRLISWKWSIYTVSLLVLSCVKCLGVKCNGDRSQSQTQQRRQQLQLLHHEQSRAYLRRGHSHNDYFQDDPLYSALRHGIHSIEVDVFPRRDQLWVAHTVFEMDSTKRIDNLYVDPLLRLLEHRHILNNDNQRHHPWSPIVHQVEQGHDGSEETLSIAPPLFQRNVFDVNPSGSPGKRRPRSQQSAHMSSSEKAEDHSLNLLVDFKGDANQSIELLKRSLQPLRPYLSRVDSKGIFHKGLVTVLISGNRPSSRDRLFDSVVTDTGSHSNEPKERYLFIDGRKSDLGPLLSGDAENEHVSDGALAPSLWVPWVSLSWQHIRWATVGRGQRGRHRYLSQIADQAHKNQQLVRVWGIPNDEGVWREMLRSHVDLVSVDDHARYALFASINSFL